jgi:molybdenum cofactor cytidylyltransferase
VATGRLHLRAHREVIVKVDSGALSYALGLDESDSLVSIVGGGGKSALLFALGDCLPGRVLLTTTTRIFAAQIQRAVSWCQVDEPGYAAALDEGPSGLLIVGGVEGEKAVGVEAALPGKWLSRETVQHVIVEADGSRMRPTKAPAEHEPVIADGSTHVVVVVGIDALSAPIAETCHRPERVGALLGLAPSARLTPNSLAQLLCHEAGGLKNVPIDARLIVLINKVESASQQARADELAARVLSEARVERVVSGAVEGPQPKVFRCYR